MNHEPVKDHNKGLPILEKPTTFMPMTRFQFFIILKPGSIRLLNLPLNVNKSY